MYLRLLEAPLKLLSSQDGERLVRGGVCQACPEPGGNWCLGDCTGGGTFKGGGMNGELCLNGEESGGCQGIGDDLGERKPCNLIDTRGRLIRTHYRIAVECQHEI